MEYSIGRAVTFVGIAILTLVLSYLYQRNERTQRASGVWTWPAIFTLLAAWALFRQLPGDPGLLGWLPAAFAIGVAIGIVRGIVFGLRPGDAPNTLLLRPNLISGAIYVIVLGFNEFVHVFYHGNPYLGRFSAAFLILTAGNSIAVNVTRLIRYRAMVASQSR